MKTPKGLLRRRRKQLVRAARSITPDNAAATPTVSAAHRGLLQETR